MYDIIVIYKNSYIRQMCGSFILDGKMVTLGRIDSLTLTPIHRKKINNQEVKIR